MTRKVFGVVLVLACMTAACGEVTPADDDAGGSDNRVLARGDGAGGASAPADAGSGGAAAGGATGSGGMTGAGGAPGAGGAMTTGAGGQAGATCADLLACCESITEPSQAQLKAQCLGAYNSATSGGTTACWTILSMIKAGGTCGG